MRKEVFDKDMVLRLVTFKCFVLHRFSGHTQTIALDNWKNSRLHVLDSEISSARQTAIANSNGCEFRFVRNYFSAEFRLNR